MPVIKIFSPGGPHLAAAVMGAMAAGLSEPVVEIPANAPKSRAEKTRRGNPNQLVCKQHVFPVRSIQRFAGADNRVAVRDLTSGRDRRAKPQDRVFCADRAWDQRAEAGYMKEIEDNFQVVADAIINGQSAISTPDQRQAVERMFALWYMRGRYRALDAQEVGLHPTTGDSHTKEEEENLEAKGYLFARTGGRMPARQFNGLQLQRRIDDYSSALSAIERWGIVTPQAGEFLVADVPTHTILPLAPKLALVGPAADGMITEENLALLNRAIRADSRRYLFARVFADCSV